MNIGKWIGKFVAILVIGALLIVLVGLLTQFLWNWLVPDLFGGPQITFVKALGLLLLSKLLFWGVGGKGGYRGRPWKQHWKEKYSKLSPEERERLKQKFTEKWCSWEEKPAKAENPTHSVSDSGTVTR